MTARHAARHAAVDTLPFAAEGSAATPILLLDAASAPAILAGLPDAVRAHVEATGFKAKPGDHILAPDGCGGLVVLFGVDGADARHPDRFRVGRLPALLPPGTYRIQGPGPQEAFDAALAWALGQYRYDEFKRNEREPRLLVLPVELDQARLRATARAVLDGRDLVNKPANVLGPQELQDAVEALGRTHDASVLTIVGEELLHQNFPMIHAVGRASPREPRLIDLGWGEAGHPKVTLVGKGVCFDTGGLNIKPDASMLLMRKDMGGAATAIAAAGMIMAAKLPVRLRLLVPAVENSISGNAFRPGDILASRKGLSVEIGNTDAEGRLILADALALACEEAPDLLLDFATLTGAARVALGPDLPPFYTDDEDLAGEIAAHGRLVHDPVWRLPLWPPYEALLDSKYADINHVGGPFAGSVTAALFLRRFTEGAKAWAHFDLYNWNPVPKSGRPEGGDIQVARLVAALLESRYAHG